MAFSQKLLFAEKKETLSGILPDSILPPSTEMGKMESGNIPESIVDGDFVFEHSGSPFPARGLIILVTRRPELSAILNCPSACCNGFGSPFWQLEVQVLRSLVALRC